jgi:hypothetical protein
MDAGRIDCGDCKVLHHRKKRSSPCRQTSGDLIDWLRSRVSFHGAPRVGRLCFLGVAKQFLQTLPSSASHPMCIASPLHTGELRRTSTHRSLISDTMAAMSPAGTFILLRETSQNPDLVVTAFTGALPNGPLDGHAKQAEDGNPKGHENCFNHKISLFNPVCITWRTIKSFKISLRERIFPFHRIYLASVMPCKNSAFGGLFLGLMSQKSQLAASKADILVRQIAEALGAMPELSFSPGLNGAG